MSIKSTTGKALRPVLGNQARAGSRWRRVKQAKFIYLLFLPTCLYFAVFTYAPFYGITIAFKDFQVFSGIGNSPWVGFEHFHTLFNSAKFPELLRNTILISLYRIVFGFPAPIIFALLLNEVRAIWFKRSVQTITYFPHFLSWVVFGGIVFNFIGPSGIVNAIMELLGKDPVQLATSSETFRALLVASGIMKEFGWGAIIYLAALAGIDPQLYEAAKMDGAGKLRQIWHVTLPGIRPIIALLFCLSLAGILDAGFEQVYIFLNPAVMGTGDIIDTYVYRVGILSANYEIATAMGLFKGVVGMIFIITANTVIRRMGERSLW